MDESSMIPALIPSMFRMFCNDCVSFAWWGTKSYDFRSVPHFMCEYKKNGRICRSLGHGISDFIFFAPVYASKWGKKIRSGVMPREDYEVEYYNGKQGKNKKAGCICPVEAHI